MYVGIEPWTFVQKLGDAVFIPAGCPHQVRNLKVKLAYMVDLFYNDGIRFPCLVRSVDVDVMSFSFFLRNVMSFYLEVEKK